MGVVLFLVVGFICVGGGVLFARFLADLAVEDKHKGMLLVGFGVGWTAFCAGLYLFLQEGLL